MSLPVSEGTENTAGLNQVAAGFRYEIPPLMSGRFSEFCITLDTFVPGDPKVERAPDIIVTMPYEDGPSGVSPVMAKRKRLINDALSVFHRTCEQVF